VNRRPVDSVSSPATVAEPSLDAVAFLQIPEGLPRGLELVHRAVGGPDGPPLGSVDLDNPTFDHPRRALMRRGIRALPGAVPLHQERGAMPMPNRVLIFTTPLLSSFS
jgi:hypothetical protein